MPAKGRPRPWVTFDADFLHQDTIEDLAVEFGPAGPLTVLALILEAKRADLGGLRPPGEQGTVSIRASALARLVGCPSEVVSSIVSRSVELGLYEYRSAPGAGSDRLVVRSLKRTPWEPKDATSAARSARKRNG